MKKFRKGTRFIFKYNNEKVFIIDKTEGSYIHTNINDDELDWNVWTYSYLEENAIILSTYTVGGEYYD
jgi:hypothetical protein